MGAYGVPVEPGGSAGGSASKVEAARNPGDARTKVAAKLPRSVNEPLTIIIEQILPLQQ